METTAPADPPLSGPLPPPAPPGRLAVVTLVIAIVVVIIGVAVATFDIDGIEEHADHRGVDGGQRYERPLHRFPRSLVSLHHEQVWSHLEASITGSATAMIGGVS